MVPVYRQWVRIEANEDGEKLVVLYAELVGLLYYFTNTVRLDISCTVCKLADFSAAPKQIHWSTIKKVVKYLKQTKIKGITVKPSHEP